MPVPDPFHIQFNGDGLWDPVTHGFTWYNINSIIFHFEGDVADGINPDDITDFKVFRNGAVLNVNPVYISHGYATDAERTFVDFRISPTLTTLGLYTGTVKFRGVTFTIYECKVVAR